MKKRLTELPISRWTKRRILQRISDITDVDFSKLDRDTLVDYFIVFSGWYCTTKFDSCKNYYRVNEDIVFGLTQTEVDSIYAEQEKWKNRKRKNSEEENN